MKVPDWVPNWLYADYLKVFRPNIWKALVASSKVDADQITNELFAKLRKEGLL
jgi:hypothetical protein